MFDKIIYFLLLFFFASAGGWLGECIYCSIAHHRIINRGFLTGPLCPIYGCGVLIMELIIKICSFFPENYRIFIVPVLAILLCDTLEFMTSLIMEKMFHARWWDYSDKFLNIQGRICFRHTVIWALVSMLYVYVLKPYVIEQLYSYIPLYVRPYLLGAILIVFAFDLIDTLKSALDIKRMLVRLEKFGETAKEATEQLSLVREAIVTDAKESMKKRKKEREESAAKRDERINEWMSSAADQLLEFRNQFESLSSRSNRRTKESFRLLNVSQFGETIRKRIEAAQEAYDKYREKNSDNKDE
ncbi:MAG: putative ABC transporter permease [Clostridia bacterium]|nr:putative ABC transporter permease [Clostridia bacterium]